MIITGIEKCYIAIQTADSSVALTYGTPAYYEGVKELGIVPAQNISKLYGENKLWAQETAFDEAAVSLSLTSLTSAQRAALLGQSTATAGGTYAKSTDSAPYVALLYKANIHGGGVRYGVLYKGKFGLPEDTMRGKEASIEFQTPVIAGAFQPTINNDMWEYHVDSTDPNYAITEDADWFGAVVVPTADAVAPTVTCVPADAASSVAVTADVVFTFSKAMDVSTLTSSNLIVMEDDGTIIAGAITYDSTLKVVTFNPTSNFDAGTNYVAIATKGCKSVTGVALAAHNVFNFETAS
jgi:phi13 family phage major tail protein